MLLLRNISYIHPNRQVLFENINLSLYSGEKMALTGNNGTGKSTLLKIMADELTPAGGQITVDAKPYYVPQIFGQYDHLTIAQALQVDQKLKALHEILRGNVTEENYICLDEDWMIDERCREAMQSWQLTGLDLSRTMSTLSGGEKTRVFLAGISIHQPELILMDEPSNHLDKSSRQCLYDIIQSTQAALLLVSHDRTLLNLLDKVGELNKNGITVYGGNYDFYATQKKISDEALGQDLQSREKALRKAKEKERESLERQQRMDSRGKGKQEKAGVAKIMMNTLRNKAENSTSKMRSVHAEKIDGISEEIRDLRASLPVNDKMRFGFDDPSLHRGKLLFSASAINVSYDGRPLWKEPVDLEIRSGERIALKGANGSGKTTLIKLVLGALEPTEGKVYRAVNMTVYIDQDYSLIDNSQTVLGQAEKFNTTGLQDHEIKSRLNRFLFTKEDWGKSAGALSGGEKMRLMLCCLTIGSQSPDLIVLDEPTNNLDIQNIEILTRAINEYQGTLIVVSHDEVFLEEVRLDRVIEVDILRI